MYDVVVVVLVTGTVAECRHGGVVGFGFARGPLGAEAQVGHLAPVVVAAHLVAAQPKVLAGAHIFVVARHRVDLLQGIDVPEPRLPVLVGLLLPFARAGEVPLVLALRVWLHQVRLVKHVCRQPDRVASPPRRLGLGPQVLDIPEAGLGRWHA